MYEFDETSISDYTNELCVLSISRLWNEFKEWSSSVIFNESYAISILSIFSVYCF